MKTARVKKHIKHEGHNISEMHYRGRGAENEKRHIPGSFVDPDDKWSGKLSRCLCAAACCLHLLGRIYVLCTSSESRTIRRREFQMEHKV
jgi:hypothetical protein